MGLETSTTCEHKFVHLRTESYYHAYRYQNIYFLTDFFFCEKCLEERKKEKYESVSIYKEVPEWAVGITNKISKL